MFRKKVTTTLTEANIFNLAALQSWRLYDLATHIDRATRFGAMSLSTGRESWQCRKVLPITEQIAKGIVATVCPSKREKRSLFWAHLQRDHYTFERAERCIDCTISLI